MQYLCSHYCASNLHPLGSFGFRFVYSIFFILLLECCQFCAAPLVTCGHNFYFADHFSALRIMQLLFHVDHRTASFSICTYLLNILFVIRARLNHNGFKRFCQSGSKNESVVPQKYRSENRNLCNQKYREHQLFDLV